jgi:hypothetical protein
MFSVPVADIEEPVLSGVSVPRFPLRPDTVAALGIET